MINRHIQPAGEITGYSSIFSVRPGWSNVIEPSTSLPLIIFTLITGNPMSYSLSGETTINLSGDQPLPLAYDAIDPDVRRLSLIHI